MKNRPGDFGSTKLLYGEEVGKDHPLLNVCGDIEELIVRIKLIRELSPNSLIRVAKDLTRISYEIKCSKRSLFREKNMFLTETDVEKLEEQIEFYRKNYDCEKDFETTEVSLCEILSRKIERGLVGLIKWEQKNFNILSPIVPREKTLDLNYLRGNTKIRTLFAQYFNRLNEFFSVFNKVSQQLACDVDTKRYDTDSELFVKRNPNKTYVQELPSNDNSRDGQESRDRVE